MRPKHTDSDRLPPLAGYSIPTASPSSPAPYSPGIGCPNGLRIRACSIPPRAAAGVRPARVQRHAVVGRRVQRDQRLGRAPEDILACRAALVVGLDRARHLGRLGEAGQRRDLRHRAGLLDPAPGHLPGVVRAPVVVAGAYRPAQAAHQRAVRHVPLIEEPVARVPGVLVLLRVVPEQLVVEAVLHLGLRVLVGEATAVPVGDHVSGRVDPDDEVQFPAVELEVPDGPADHLVHVPQVGASLLRHPDAVTGVARIAVEVHRRRLEIVDLHLVAELVSARGEHHAARRPDPRTGPPGAAPPRPRSRGRCRPG